MDENVSVDLKSDSETGKTSEVTDPEPSSDSQASEEIRREATFMDTLDAKRSPRSSSSESSMEGKMLTENADIAFSSTRSSLLDLFQELETVISGPRARELLEVAWKQDSAATLKLIWNARSIHLGKGERQTFYRCLGWLAKNHPLTMILNLKWLCLWTIEKKAPKDESEKKAVMVERSDAVDMAAEGRQADAQWLVKNGGAHGYFKDLLNILVLQTHGALDIMADPRTALNVKNERDLKRKFKSYKERQEACDKEKAREKRHSLEEDRQKKVLDKYQDDSLYRALHLTVARLFAEQLSIDLKLLAGDKRSKNRVSLAAKWAPNLERFHDKHTLIATSIAEILYSCSDLFPNSTEEISRTTYLKHAREAFRGKVLSPLRAQLATVERDICAETFDRIQYSRIPSLAMNRYSSLFAEKDIDHFSAYITDVASGKSQISGVILVPSLLVMQSVENSVPERTLGSKDQGVKAMVLKKKKEISAQVANGQWNSLVQRIKDSGKLRSAVAVCDVSGSMHAPTFPDGTTPIHSSLGLSLLLAEVTEPPFGGGIITFSESPQFHRVGSQKDDRDFYDKLVEMVNIRWGFNTNFVAVFEDLILPMALQNNVAPEDMVRTIFVFSDMQFDQAQCHSRGWNKSSYERIKKAYEESGYEMPQLVF